MVKIRWGVDPVREKILLGVSDYEKETFISGTLSTQEYMEQRNEGDCAFKNLAEIKQANMEEGQRVGEEVKKKHGL